MRECFQESFLRGFFSLTAVAKKAVRNVEYARAEAANDFGKGGLVGIAREAGQFNFGRLFVVVRQQCSSIEVDRTASGSDRRSLSRKSMTTCFRRSRSRGLTHYLLSRDPPNPRRPPRRSLDCAFN